MIRGFTRLGVIVVVLAWVGAAVFQWRQLEKDIWLIEMHVSPYLRGPMTSIPPNYNSWPVYAAGFRFIALPEPERVSAASDFYERHVRPLENEYFMGHGDAFKSWFLTTARLGVDEAPVLQMDGVRYRDFNLPGIPIAPRLSYVFFSQNVTLLTCLVSGVTMAFAIVSTLAIRWVYRGFLAKQKANP